MATECTPTLFAFEAVERKAVVACFDGGRLAPNPAIACTSAAPAMLSRVGQCSSRRTRTSCVAMATPRSLVYFTR